jgi:hypothetical protein
MLISEFIKKLTIAQEKYGDVQLSTWDGVVSGVSLRCAVDGVFYPLKDEDINEISMEIYTHDRTRPY